MNLERLNGFGIAAAPVACYYARRIPSSGCERYGGSAGASAT